MYFKPFYDEDLAQSSYLIACQSERAAVVVDPRRDIGVYLEDAAREGFSIVGVTETHIHADYLSGSRELAHATGATLHVSGEGDAHSRYGFGDERLRHGDDVRLGNVRIDALHTPGHTPEHLSFLITDLSASDVPTILLTGDFVFVGDVGRPDLLDEAAGFVDTRYAGAEALFASLRDRFLGLPDHVQVWPGHGAGSACGKALGAVPSTTVGYERLTSWWARYLREGDREGFTSTLLHGQPDAPAYFGRMKEHNRRGPTILGARERVRRIEPHELAARLGERAVLFDTRTAERFRADRVRHALFVPDGRSFVTYASYAFDPATDDREVILLAPDADHAGRLRDALSRVGIDRVVGYVPTLRGLPRDPVAGVSPRDLDGMERPLLLDVRTAAEHAEGHIPGARQIHVGRLRSRMGELPRDRTIVVHCQSGGRAAVAEGILRDAGYDRVVDLTGSYAAWSASGAKTV